MQTNQDNAQQSQPKQPEAPRAEIEQIGAQAEKQKKTATERYDHMLKRVKERMAEAAEVKRKHEENKRDSKSTTVKADSVFQSNVMNREMKETAKEVVDIIAEFNARYDSTDYQELRNLDGDSVKLLQKAKEFMIKYENTYTSTWTNFLDENQRRRTFLGMLRKINYNTQATGDELRIQTEINNTVKQARENMNALGMRLASQDLTSMKGAVTSQTRFVDLMYKSRSFLAKQTPDTTNLFQRVVITKNLILEQGIEHQFNEILDNTLLNFDFAILDNKDLYLNQHYGEIQKRDLIAVIYDYLEQTFKQIVENGFYINKNGFPEHFFKHWGSIVDVLKMVAVIMVEDEHIATLQNRYMMDLSTGMHQKEALGYVQRQSWMWENIGQLVTRNDLYKNEMEAKQAYDSQLVDRELQDLTSSIFDEDRTKFAEIYGDTPQKLAKNNWFFEWITRKKLNKMDWKGIDPWNFYLGRFFMYDLLVQMELSEDRREEEAELKRLAGDDDEGVQSGEDKDIENVMGEIIPSKQKKTTEANSAAAQQQENMSYQGPPASNTRLQKKKDQTKKNETESMRTWDDGKGNGKKAL